ncbi:MAG TPA: RraA family protein [Conexibacter sp.]|nr:RraA family protein [Conexibacter sp.]
MSISLNETERFDALAGRLYSAVVSDILDTLGHPDQVVRAGLRPATSGDWTLVGRVRTARADAVSERPERPYAELLGLIDTLQTGDVLMIDAGGRDSSGIFGGLLATAVKAAGGRGAIIDGDTRDLRELERLAFPTLARGGCPADSLGRDEVVETDGPIECGGVRIESGDLVVADSDGIVVVPRALEQQVVELALEKVAGEDVVRRELANGMPASVAFERYGIL